MMRIYRVLQTPWVASSRSARWLFVFVLMLVALGYMLGYLIRVPQRVWPFSAVMFGVGNAACWLLLLPNGLLLALAARRLRLPGINRDVVWGLLLYAALGIGVPMLFQFPQGHVFAFAIIQVLVALGVMLFMVLPYYLVLGSYLVLLVFHRVLSHAVSIPRPSDPRFVLWGGVLAVVLLAALVWRSRQLLSGSCAEHGSRAPTMIFLRRKLGREQSDPLTDAGSMRKRLGWLIVRPDLRNVGPQAPMTSLRVALGGVYLPQTIVSRLYQLIPAVFAVALFIGPLFFTVTFNDHSLSQALHYVFSHDDFWAVSWMFAVFSLALVMRPVELLALRWGRSNAELPLLALLPGLGRAGQQKRLMLCTAMMRPAMQLGSLLLLGWLGVVCLGVGWSVALAMLVVALGCLGYLYAMVLSTFGGVPLANFGKSLLLIGMFLLLSLTAMLPQSWQGWDVLYVARASDALVAAWLALTLFLLWLGWRGWRGLRQLACPFSPN